MPADNKSLERFLQAVDSDTASQIEDIETETDMQKRQILAQADEAAEEAAERYIAEHAVRDSSYMKEVSAAELEMKKSVLRRREELIGQVFANTEKRLKEFRRSKRYAACLENAAKSAGITEGSVVFLAPDDMRFEKNIRRAVPGIKELSFEKDGNIRLGGLSVFRPDSSTAVDLTFDTALEEQRGQFAASDPFGGIFMTSGDQ